MAKLTPAQIAANKKAAQKNYYTSNALKKKQALAKLPAGTKAYGGPMKPPKLGGTVKGFKGSGKGTPVPGQPGKTYLNNLAKKK